METLNKERNSQNTSDKRYVVSASGWPTLRAIIKRNNGGMKTFNTDSRKALELLSRYKGMIQDLVFRYKGLFHGSNYYDQDDLFMELWVWLIYADESYDPDRCQTIKKDTYIYTTLKQRAIDISTKHSIHSRREWKKISKGGGSMDVSNRSFSEFLENTIFPESDEEEEIVEMMDAKTIIPEIKKICDILIPRYSNILYLHFFEGKTLKAIANEMGVCDSRVSQLKTKALNIIKFYYSDTTKNKIHFNELVSRMNSHKNDALRTGGMVDTTS